MQMLIALHICARGLDEGELMQRWSHHVLRHIPLQIIPCLEVCLLRRRLPHAIDQRIDVLIRVVGGVGSRPGIDHPRNRIGIQRSRGQIEIDPSPGPSSSVAGRSAGR